MAKKEHGQASSSPRDKMLKAGIIGATGYTGLALISTLISHPNITVSLITSNTYKGKKISDIFPLLKGRFEETLVPTDDNHSGKCDVYFLCLPHGTSMEAAKKLFDGKALIVDLSADFRFEDVKVYEGAHLAVGLVRDLRPGIIKKRVVPPPSRGSVCVATSPAASSPEKSGEPLKTMAILEPGRSSSPSA